MYSWLIPEYLVCLQIMKLIKERSIGTSLHFELNDLTGLTNTVCFVPANITRWTGIANAPARIVKSEKRCGAVRKSHLFIVVGTDAGEIVALEGTEISTTIPAVPCWEAMENASRSTVFHDGMRSTCRICPSIVVSVKRNSPSTRCCRPVWLFSREEPRWGPPMVSHWLQRAARWDRASWSHAPACSCKQKKWNKLELGPDQNQNQKSNLWNKTKI